MLSDQGGKAVYATVIDKHGSNLKIHFVGWLSHWDCYIDCEKEFYRFAQPYSISMRPAHRLKNIQKGDFIDININPVVRHRQDHPRPCWCVGKVRKLDHKSGQVKVGYNYQYNKQEFHFHWDHLDNEQVFAPFKSKTGVNNSNDDIAGQQANLNMIIMQLQNKNKNKNKNKNNINNSHSGIHSQNQKFPKYCNEIIDNKYKIGSRLQVLNIVRQEWKYCTVTDKEHNWIVVHFDGESSRKNEKLHIKRSRDRIRTCTHAELQKENQEKEQKDNSNINENKSNCACKNKNNQITNECRICFDNIINTVCTPCGHASMCRKCSNDYIKQNSDCPICRKKFDNVFDFFIA